jgi:hypothetical protein
LLLTGCFEYSVPAVNDADDPIDTSGGTGSSEATAPGDSSDSGGSGGPMSGCVDDSDCDDGNPCTDDACEALECVHVPRLDDPACACEAASDCTLLPEDDACQHRACVEGFCAQELVDEGTPAPEVDQTAEDCLVLLCDGAGGLRDEIDDADVPVDGLECTSDLCEDGVPSNPPHAEGTTCAAGTCNAQGECTGCETADECGGESTFCAQVTCIASVCGIDVTAPGTALPDGDQTTGDCVRIECDGKGNAAPAAQDSDVPSDDGDPCTDDTCEDGVVVHPPAAANTACSDGGVVCDGNGSCVECNNNAQCSGGNACNLPACSDHACTTAPAPSGTACNDGQPCTATDTCNASGACVGSGNPCAAQVGDNDSDCSESCNPATGACTANDPAGSACNDGLFCTANDTCNGSGTCSGSGNPCPGADGDTDCTESCNETTNSCSAPDPNGSDCGNCRFCSGGTCDFECVTGEVCCPEFELCLPPQFC